jgi:hypothetical protein
VKYIQAFFEETNEIHEKRQSEQATPRLRIKPGASRIRRNSYHSSATFGTKYQGTQSLENFGHLSTDQAIIKCKTQHYFMVYFES